MKPRGRFQSYANYKANRTIENERIKKLLKGKLVHLSAVMVPKRDADNHVIIGEYRKIVVGGTYINPERQAKKAARRAAAA